MEMALNVLLRVPGREHTWKLVLSSKLLLFYSFSTQGSGSLTLMRCGALLN